MKRPKVLLLTHNYPINSKERRNAGIFVHDFAKELTRSGLSVSVFCPSASRNPNKVDGIPVYWLGWGRKDRNLRDLKIWNPYDLLEMLIFFFKGVSESLKFAEKIKPDFCISMWAVPSGIFAYFIKKKFGVPYVVWVLGSDIYIYSRIPIFGFIITRILKSARYLFADGFELSRIVSSIAGRRCSFLQSATTFSLPAKRDKKRLNKKQIVLTFLGRMEPEKGPDLLIEALLQIKGKIRNFKVNFLGDGSLLALLKSDVEKDELGDYITFYGNVDDKRKIVSVLYNSHWVIIPSRSDSIPLVFSEAMRAGTPVITSTLADLKYLVNKYKVGLYFKTGAAKGLARIIKGLPRQTRIRKIFAKNTNRAAQFFSIEESAQQFLRVWKNGHKTS